MPIRNGSSVCRAAPDRFRAQDAVWIANIDGTGEKKIADGIFPAISSDGTRVAFNTVEKTSDTTYVRHIAVVEVATSKVNVFKDVPSDNSYYPSWTADGKQILFTTRPHEVWDLVTINSDGTNFHVLKPGIQNEVTRYSPICAPDGQSVFCEDMSNIYQLGLDGAVRAQWKIDKIVPKGDMSGDGRIDVSPDGKQLAFSIMAEKDWHLGLVNADDSGFRFVKNAELKSEAFGAPAWARDGRSIFCHDLDNLYRIDLDGNVLKKWEITKVLTEASMNSNDRISVSPDGNTLLMDGDCGAEHERKNWDGPQAAIFKFDLPRRRSHASLAKTTSFGNPIG